MPESINHHCALAGMRAGEECQWNVPSVIEAMIREQWNRGGAGWGLRGVIDGSMEADAGGTRRATLAHNKERQSKREEPVTTAVGHGSYVTSGSKNPAQRQPFEFEAAGMRWSFAFNGNLANYPALKEKLDIGQPDVDTEAIRRILTAEIEKRTAAIQQGTHAAIAEVFDALEQQLDGCFNIVLINERNEMFAYRDHQGMRPVVWAKTRAGDTLVASENSAIARIMGRKQIESIHHLGAGQLLICDATGETTLNIREPKLARCFFEWLYFARDLSSLDERSVKEVRKALGFMLAIAETGGSPEELPAVAQSTASPAGTEDSTAICFGVPKSGTTAGETFALGLGIRYEQAVERIPESDRSFTKGSQQEREQTAEEKFLYHPEQIRGKDVYVVEDSVVRGTTMQVLARHLREHGAKSIHLRITCPAVIGPCFYGIDFPTIQELLLGKHRETIIANGWKLTPEIEQEIAEILGVDSVKFLGVEEMLAAFEHCDIPQHTLCAACVRGTEESYPTPAGKERFQLAILGQDTFGMTGQ